MKLDIAVTIDHFLICNRFLHIITLKKPKKDKRQKFSLSCLFKNNNKNNNKPQKNTSKKCKKTPCVFLLHLAMETKLYLILWIQVPKRQLYRLHRNTKTSISFSAFFILFQFYWQIVCGLNFLSGKCLNFIISLWPHELSIDDFWGAEN